MCLEKFIQIHWSYDTSLPIELFSRHVRWQQNSCADIFHFKTICFAFWFFVTPRHPGFTSAKVTWGNFFAQPNSQMASMEGASWFDIEKQAWMTEDKTEGWWRRKSKWGRQGKRAALDVVFYQEPETWDARQSFLFGVHMTLAWLTWTTLEGIVFWHCALLGGTKKIWGDCFRTPRLLFCSPLPTGVATFVQSL